MSKKKEEELETKDNASSVGNNAPASKEQETTAAPVRKTMAEIFANAKKEAEQEKTDAQKMQRYYALADVFKSLGKMGGAVVGGAIGGNILDSAPNVGEFKESRGYIDAFERAKKANERIKQLTDKEYELAYTKEQRDEERAYNEAREKANREYNAAQAEINRRWQADQQRINREWQQVVADKDFERQAALKKELAQIDQNYKLEIQRINNAHEYALKQISSDIVNLQMNNKVPFSFDNGTSVDLTKKDYEGLKRKYINKRIDGIKVTEDNIDMILGKNPKLVEDYFASFGKKVSFNKAEQGKEEPQTTLPSSKVLGGTPGSSPYYYDMWKANFANEQLNKPQNYVNPVAPSQREALNEYLEQYK